jgi:rhamnosyltransferase
VFAHDYERCFGLNRDSSKWKHFFSMASSGVRKDVWAKRGFNERLQYSEDDEFTRSCVARGYRIRYVPESVVMHSHNYSATQSRTRGFGEGRALAAVSDQLCPQPTWWRNVLLGWLKDAQRDLIYCARTGRSKEWPHALRIRWQQRTGALAGFRSGWVDYRQPRNCAAISPPTWTADLHG